jgi:flavin-dependent dehydrogenase
MGVMSKGRYMMKYDLIVIGGGPGGLMAAKTAAEDGLKVLLIERKKNVTEVKRWCGQFTNINMLSVGGKVKYGYIESLNLEVGTDTTKVHFPGPGFSIDYKGSLRSYFNYVYFSPSGYHVYREKDRFFGFCWDKEFILTVLLGQAEKNRVDVMTGAFAIGIENTSKGVQVRVRITSGEQSLEARMAIVADGKDSRMVESLGLNKKRQVLGRTEGVGYMMEGVDTEFRLNSWLAFTLPQLNTMNITMHMVTGDRNILGTAATGGRSPVETIDKFMRLPYFAQWFRNARVVRKLADAATTRTPIPEPVAGNVVIVGDAGAMVETSNPGAIACGFKAAKATVKELNGQNGYQEYIDWWQRAFDFNQPDYLKAAGRYFSLNQLCSHEEIDYLYHLIQGQIGVPTTLIAKNLEQVKDERPGLYAKLRETGMGASVDNMKLELGKILEKPVEQRENNEV